MHISGQRLYFGKSACPIFELGIAAGADTGLTPFCWTSIVPAAIDAKMPVQKLNQVSVPLHHRERTTLLSSLKPILEVEEDDDDESWTTLPSLPSQQLGPGHASKKRPYFWYCCQCGDGPSSVKIIPACPECFHHRCDDCARTTTK